MFSSTGGAIYGEGDGQTLPLDDDAPILPIVAYEPKAISPVRYLALERSTALRDDATAAIGRTFGESVIEFCALDPPRTHRLRRSADPDYVT